MGVNCKIHTRDNGTVEMVEAPNGDVSTLYKDALAHTNNETQALNLWTVPYTIGFQKVNGNWETEGTLTLKDGEPKLKDVLNYLKFTRNEGKTLSNQEISELGNNLYSLPINTFEELFNEIRSTFYKNGIFEITKNNLDNSLLYSELEVLDIISNPSLQNKIKNVVEKIETQFLSESDSKVDELIKTYFFQDEDLLIDSTTNVGIGKHNAFNPFVIEKELASYLAGITSRNEFDNKVKDLPYEAIVAKYQTDNAFAEKMFKRFSNLDVIPVMKEIDGNVARRTQTDTKATLKEVLITDLPTFAITDDLFLLAELDVQLWEENLELVKQVLKQVENNLVPFNIDVVGLSESVEEKTQKEVLDFVNKIDIFVDQINTSNVTEQNVDTFSSEIDSYFNIDVLEENRYEQLSQSNKGRTLVQLTPTSNDITLFRENSLLRTKEGLFHKVNVIENINTLYNTVYDLAIRDNSLLPKQAFYPTAFDTNNTFNRGKLNKVENRELILQDIKRFIDKQVFKYNEGVTAQDVDSLKKMVIYKMLFKHPLNNTKTVDVSKELVKINNLKTDVGYLATTFISDFYNYQLTNKIGNTNLYNNVLKHFSVDERGIVLKQDDLHTKQQINLLSPSNEVLNNLRQYVLIARDNSLDGLFPSSESVGTTLNNRETNRKLVMSNPEVLSFFKGNYDTDGDLLITPNEKENFIKTSKGIYEKIAQHGNATFYRQLPSFSNPYFKDYGLKVKNQTKIDLNKYNSYIVDKIGSQTKVSNLYSKKELGNINNKIDECQ